MNKLKENDFIGKTFNKLTIISFTNKKTKDNRVIVICKCLCGKMCEKNLKNVRNGNIKSCGCYRKKREISTYHKNPQSHIMNGNKICIICKKEKNVCNFNYRKDTQKYRNQCQECFLEQKNIHSKHFYLKNKEDIDTKHREYYKNNREKRLKHFQENRKEINKYRRNKRKNDLSFKLGENLRRRINKLLGSQKSGSAIRDLGCSIEELKKHLENKFYPNSKTGEVMTWSSWNLQGWHIDHIKPLASFDLTDRKQFLEACHYTNLQPLWAKENLSKGKKYNG